MSTQRRGQLPRFEAEHGYSYCVENKLCRECGRKVQPPRRTWCSDQCVEDHRLRSDPGYQRMAVFNRDRGICSECGLDCVELRAKINPVRMLYGSAFSVVAHYRANGSVVQLLTAVGRKREFAEAVNRACQVVLDHDLVKHLDRRDSLWDMDHRVPLWEGGTNNLANLVTLCIACHAEKTSAGTSRRASQRRDHAGD